MLDVHPPEHAARSWRDFFVHIATIVVGLLLAIGLEQTVESIHHGLQVRETRKVLAEERRVNRENYRLAVIGYVRDAAVLHNDLRVFSYLQQHPGTPAAKLPGVVIWPSHIFRPTTSAWTAAGQTTVLSMMPREEVAADSSTYSDLQRVVDGYVTMTRGVASAAAYSLQTSDPSTLPPARVAKEIELIEQANALHVLYGLWLETLHREEPDFVPAFDDRQVFLFTDFPAPDTLRAQLPEAWAATAHDLQTADSALQKFAAPAN